MASSHLDKTAGSSGFMALFQDALDAYQAETKRDLKLDTLRATLKTPEDLLAYIESQGKAFQDFRNKHGKLWTRIHTVLRPVAAVGSIAQTAVNSVSPFGPPASAVLGAVLYLITAADGVKDAYDWIQTLFGEFEMFAIRLQEYISPSHDLNPALQDRLGAILTCMLRLFGRAEVMIKSGRFKEYLRTAFLGKDDKTKGLLDELNIQLKNEQGLIIALTFNATRNAEDYSKSAAESTSRIENQLEELKLTNTEIIARLEEQEKEELSEDQIKDMKQMLETPAANTVARLLSTQKRDLVSGTGGWLEKEAHFSTWRSGRAPILWILGGPGSGKSFLATWAITHLQEYFSSRTDSLTMTAVAYFFIKDYDAELVDANNILKTLALQIADVDTAFARYAALNCMERTATITEHDTWESLFVGFYSSAEAKDSYAVLILDGLDEAPAPVRKKLLAMVKSVTGTGKANPLGDRVQFGIFGRTELRSDFEFNRQEKFIMVSLKNQDDIANFIVSRLSEISLVKVMESKGPAGQKQATKLRDTITRKVVQGADGVFLWAKLLMKELEELNAAQIGRVLKNPPQSLDEMISKLFHRISRNESVDSAEVSRMMMFICFAQQPLLFGELKLFLSLPNRQPDILLWRNIRGRFASLFELKYPAWYDPDEIDDNEQNDLDEVTLNNPNEPTDESMNDAQIVDDNHEEKEEEGVGELADDDDEDFDFGDDGDADLITYDLGTAPSDARDAQEYANTIHDDDGQLKTSLRFTHQRIKDYLIAAGSQSSTKVSSNDIRVDVQRAEIDMTISCLQALQLGNEGKGHRAYLVEYPARNFVLHLAKVQEEHLTTEDTKEIITGLLQLFSSDQTSKALLIAAKNSKEGATGRDEFWAMWMSCQTHRKVVQRWLCKPETETLVTDNNLVEWLHRAQKSLKALLEPLMRGASQIWLTKTGYDDKGYLDKSEWLVDVLRAFVSMDESGVVTNDLYDNWSWLRSKCQPPVTSAELYKVAKWAGIERTTHWHTGLGWILMTFQFNDLAIAEYNKAIELDPKAWVAMEGKARSLKGQMQHEEAIAMMTQAIENLPPSMEWLGAYLYPWISSSKQVLGDKRGAHEAAAQAYDLDTGSTFAQLQYISTLCDIEGSFQDVVNVLDHLNCIIDLDTQISWLVRFFHSGYDIYDKIGLACKECGAPIFLLEAMDKAIEWSQGKASTRQMVMMTMRAAQIQYRYYSHDNEAIELYEKALKLIAEEDPEDSEEFQDDRIIIHNELGLVLFDMAVAAKKANQGYSRLSTRLKELSVALDSSADHHSFEFYNTGYPSLLWGRWLREYEEENETVWRKPFRARLLDQINMLDDEDPANDSYALKAVAKSLFHAGDRENAGAILAILFRLLEDYIEERDGKMAKSWVAVEVETTEDSGEQTPETEATQPSTFIGPQMATPGEFATTENRTNPKVEGTELALTVNKDDWMYTCDQCGKDAEAVAEMYFCEICDDKNWCDECLPRVKNGTLSRRDCNPEHSFYRAWPVPDEARHSAVTWLEGEPRLRKQWLEALRSQWL